MDKFEKAEQQKLHKMGKDRVGQSYVGRGRERTIPCWRGNRINWTASIGLSRRRKPPSRIIFCKAKNRRKFYGLAEKPLRIILWLAAEKNAANHLRQSRILVESL